MIDRLDPTFKIPEMNESGIGFHTTALEDESTLVFTGMNSYIWFSCIWSIPLNLHRTCPFICAATSVAAPYLHSDVMIFPTKRAKRANIRDQKEIWCAEAILPFVLLARAIDFFEETPSTWFSISTSTLYRALDDKDKVSSQSLYAWCFSFVYVWASFKYRSNVAGPS